jgi:hypothetical protein
VTKLEVRYFIKYPSCDSTNGPNKIAQLQNQFQIFRNPLFMTSKSQRVSFSSSTIISQVTITVISLTKTQTVGVQEYKTVSIHHNHRDHFKRV